MTLDEDVAAKLKQTARERGVSFKSALNDAVRKGLAGGSPSSRRFRVQARPLGVRAGVNLEEEALRLADELEDAEIMRKLELRK